MLIVLWIWPLSIQNRIAFKFKAIGTFKSFSWYQAPSLSLISLYTSLSRFALCRSEGTLCQLQHYTNKQMHMQYVSSQSHTQLRQFHSLTYNVVLGCISGQTCTMWIILFFFFFFILLGKWMCIHISCICIQHVCFMFQCKDQSWLTIWLGLSVIILWLLRVKFWQRNCIWSLK